MNRLSDDKVPLVQVADLMAPGMPLPFKILDGQGRLLLAQGQVIADVRQLQALLDRGACVRFVEAELARAAKNAAAGASKVGSARRLTWFDRWEQQVWALDALLRAAGNADNPLLTPLVNFADALMARVDQYPDAALYKCVRQDDKRFALYALTHALNCSVVVMLAARQMGWPSERVRSVVCAALTMNTSIIELQGRMAEQKDPPSKQQMEQIRAHPHRSAEMLRASGVTDPDWLEAVEDHHERATGPGYPRGIEPGEMARLLRAADVFTAKISPRAGRPPMVPQLAARQLFQDEGGGAIAGALIKAVGVYPPGDFVTLKNGETAVVVQRTANANAPVVAALMAANGKPIHGAPRRQTQDPAFAITAPVQDRSQMPRVLPEVVYGALE